MQLLTKSGVLEVDEIAITALRNRYPAADLSREFPAMHLWLLKNPAKRPANGWRFIDNWLKKCRGNFAAKTAQDRAKFSNSIWGANERQPAERDISAEVQRVA